RALDLIPSNALDELKVRDSWGKELAAATTTGSLNQTQTARSVGEAPNSQRLNAPPPPNFGALHFAWQTTGDKRFLETLYANQIETSALRKYMNTEGSMWIDRVDVPNSELQRARLGGVALVRGSLYPGHAVSWTFAAPARAEDVAILISESTPQSVKIMAYNLSSTFVNANLLPWNLEPGQWEVTQGRDSRGDGLFDDAMEATQVEWDHDHPLNLTLAPRTTTVILLKLVSKATPYWNRPDLGIGKDDVLVKDRKVTVTVHSLGSADAPATRLALLDANGKVITAVDVPPLKAPLDLMPKTTKITLTLPRSVKGGSVVLDPDRAMKEITRVNNQVQLN
ncbi:MAG TPA: hypothetical protein VHP99_10930, partial [Pyrinomonadaceae bacterium]|nr:hypothetical protein [Pyrinomonadaceae bacterium]